MRTPFFLLAIASLFLLSACDENKVFEAYESISNLEWAKDRVISFDVPIHDVSINHNFSIPIRYSIGFPAKNLFLKMVITPPSGEPITQEKEVFMLDENGDYVGSGMGDIYDVTFPILENHKLEAAGTYKVQISHQMPIDPLPLVLEVGLRVDKVGS